MGSSSPNCQAKACQVILLCNISFIGVICKHRGFKAYFLYSVNKGIHNTTMAFVCRNQSGIQMGIVGILHIVKDISHCYYMLNKMCYSNMGIQFSERKSKSVHTLKCEEASVLDSYPHHSMYKWGIPCYQPHDITPLQMQIALKCIFVKGVLVNQRCFRGHST